MHSLGELLGVIAKSHARNGVWVSPTNLVNGKLPTAVGVVNNFGSPASLADLNLIANVGGNMVINRGGVNMLWDFYSQSVGESPEKFLTVVLLQIYLKRTLQPYLESFLTKPNKPSTWSDIYYGVRSFLDNLVGAAIDSWKWDGDQFATSLDQLQVNDPVLVGQGKYKAVLTVVLIVPMVEFSLDISMTTSQSVVIS